MEKGINLIGYAKSEQGIGEGCRLTAKAISKTDIAWSVYDFELNNPCRQNDITLQNEINNTISYNISILNINADQLLSSKDFLPRRIWKTYRIGVWYWELPVLPDEWNDAFDYLDEIWAPTKFIKETLEKSAKCPVYYMPPGLYRDEPNKKYDRDYYKLPKNKFLFLSMFDMYSYTSRKNPQAAIKAFQTAFPKSCDDVGLVLKINNNINNNSKEYKELLKLIKGYNNIYLISEILTREEINALLCCCDAAISLHRSEGLGLLCQEAMYFGKPVIATGWSGNMDFMNENNSCLVSYKMIKASNYIGITADSKSMWADPDVDEAAGYMQKLYNNKDYYYYIADKAKKTIFEKFSPEICGKRMKERFDEIQNSNIINRTPSEAMPKGIKYTEDIEYIKDNWQLDYYKLTEFSDDKSFIKRLLQRIVRKICMPLLLPIINKQNELNYAILRELCECKRD